jgi:hypothetical protein
LYELQNWLIHSTFRLEPDFRIQAQLLERMPISADFHNTLVGIFGHHTRTWLSGMSVRLNLTDERKGLYMDRGKEERTQVAAGSLFKRSCKIAINMLQLTLTTESFKNLELAAACRRQGQLKLRSA